MGRSGGHKTQDKNKGSFPQVPQSMKSDGVDVEFSQEHADHADLEAQARSIAADHRVKTKR